MAKSQETYTKKEVRNRKEKKRKDKEQKRQERRSQTRVSNSFDDMIAYVDEHGRITSEPPDPLRKSRVKAEDIEVSVPRKQNENTEMRIRTGILTFFNESKGFGFIRDLGESIFVHVNDMESLLKENVKVTFEIEQGYRGAKAVRVKPV
jgi:cold shock CspA family protein